jgi:hypothetical protein
MSDVNAHTQKRAFRYEALNQLPKIIRRNDFVGVLDLKNMFHSFALHPSCYKYFSFRYEGEMYSYRCLPQGWCLSPWFVTKIMKAVTHHIRSVLGVRCLLYLDDFIILTRTGDEMVAAREAIISLLTKLGLEVNMNKGNITAPPTRQAVWLGVLIDTERALFAATPLRLSKLSHACLLVRQYAHSHCRWVKLLHLQRVLGLAQSLMWCIPTARYLLGGLYALLRGANNGDVRLGKQELLDLAALRRLDEFPSRALLPVLPQADYIMTSDASDFGWGASLHRADGTLVTVPASGFFSPREMRLPISSKECLGAVRGVTCYVDKLLDTNILFLTDSKNLVDVAARMMSRSLDLQIQWRALQDLLRNFRCTATFRHLRGVLNVISDYYSRLNHRHEWSLHPDVITQVLAWLGWTPTLDLFATAGNSVVPRFMALSGPGSENIDAMSQSWNNEALWVCPPWPLLGDVVQRLLYVDSSPAVLIAPRWLQAPWFPLLLQMGAVELQLGGVEDVVVSNFPHLPAVEPHSNNRWTMSAFYIPPRQVRVGTGSQKAQGLTPSTSASRPWCCATGEWKDLPPPIIQMSTTLIKSFADYTSFPASL